MNNHILLILAILSLNLLSSEKGTIKQDENLFDKNLACLDADGIRLKDHPSAEEILFFLACMKLDIPQIKMMLEKNPALSFIRDADEKTPLHLLIERKNGPQLIEVAQLILTQNNTLEACDSDGKTPLCYACDNEKWDIAYLLLSYGADINIEISSGIPLHTLIRKERIDLIKFFIQNGAKDLRDQSYFFSLHHACEEGKIEIIKLILKELYKLDLKSFKIDPSLGKEFNRKVGCTDNSHDALSCAIRCKNLETTRLLLKYHIAEIGAQHLLLPADSKKNSFAIFKEIAAYICGNNISSEDIDYHSKRTIFMYYTSNKNNQKSEFIDLVSDLIEFVSFDYFKMHEEDSFYTTNDLDDYNQFIGSLKQNQLNNYRVACEETGFKRTREYNKILQSNKMQKKI